jgi:outer membrane protein assembly factor BamD
MRKCFVIATLVMAAVVTAGGVNCVQAQKQQLTKEERRVAREREVAQRANAATELKIAEGKAPSYNRLLKSTNYELMYTEGLRYYNMKKKGEDYNTSANYQKAQNLFDAAFRSQRFVGTERQDSISYYLGCSFYKSGSFDVSEQIFDGFRQSFPNSIFIEDVEYMYAMGFYFSSPDPEYDQTRTLRAMASITDYQRRYPNTVKKTECEERMLELQQKLYKKSYENARLYYTIGQYKAAVKSLNNAIDEYPESPYREELMYLATRSAYLFAKNSIFSMQTDRYMSMMDNYYNLISEYPGTKHLREVEKMQEEASTHITKYTTEDTATTTIQQENGN